MPQMFSVQRSKPIVSRRSPEICHWQPQRWNNQNPQEIPNLIQISQYVSEQSVQSPFSIELIMVLQKTTSVFKPAHCLRWRTGPETLNRHCSASKKWSIEASCSVKRKKRTTNTKCKNDWSTPLCSTAAAWAANLDFVATFWTWRHTKMNLSELEWGLKSWRHANKSTYSKLAVFMLKGGKSRSSVDSDLFAKAIQKKNLAAILSRMTCHVSFRFCLALFQLSKLGCFFNGGSEIFVTESLAANDLETPKNSPTHCTWKSLTTSGNSSFFMSFCHQHPNCACMTQQKKHPVQSLCSITLSSQWTWILVPSQNR